VSVPARKIEGTPATSPAKRRTPTTRARPAVAKQVSAKRRGLHHTFLVFASVVVILLVVGVVALNALFAQTAFAVHSMQTHVDALDEQNDVLATDAAQLSSPSRIATWAERYQMVLPDNVVILRVAHFGRTRSGGS
jgi:cell division protein FtsL